MNRVVFIGPVGEKINVVDGVCVKNKNSLYMLKKYFNHITVCDTLYWRTNPFVLLKILCFICFAKHCKFILSLNTKSANRLIKILSVIGKTHEVFYFVPGGMFPRKIKEGFFDVSYYKKLKAIMVQGNILKNQLNEQNLHNVFYCPNFKKMDYIPPKKIDNEFVKFVFLSRIIPDKGCDLILSAASKLQETNGGKYVIDFYGSISDTYKQTFLQKISTLNNVEYKGKLNLMDSKNYDLLASYDVMLFPTYWDGEGFPGVVIDAYISGLPIIASDWNINKEIIIENETGWIIPVKDEFSLYKKMEQIIIGDVNLTKMKENCQKRAILYSVNNVLSSSFYKEIGLID